MANEPDRDYSESIEKKFRALELRIEQDVVRRLHKAKEITSTADWQLNRYYVLGHSTADIEKIFKETVGDTYPEVFELYDRVLAQQYVRTAELYEQINEEATPFDQNPEMRQLINGLIKTSNDQLQNITGSMGFMLDYGNGKMVFSPLAEVYDRYLDQAMIEIASGVFDYNTVLRRVARQLTHSGLRVIEYASGHTNRCDVAARRAIMTGIAQLTSAITQQNAMKLGTKYYEVEWHAGARPEHMVWQGKVYSEDDLRRVCGLGDPLGLCGINCYHTYYPFIPGVSERNYSDEWLAEMNAAELTPTEYRGKEYTRYEAEQRQRYLETCIRAQREKVSLLKTGGADHDDVIIQQCRYQAMLDEYRKFSKAMNLPTQMERVYTGRTTGRIAPNKTVYAQWQAEQAQKAVTKKGAGVTIKGMSARDVTEEYTKTAKPGSGRIQRQEGFVDKNHEEEILTAEWIHSTFGGDVLLLKEVNENHKKTPDMRWKEREWERKGLRTSNRNTIDQRVREARTQINNTPGGMIMDFSKSELSLAEAVTYVKDSAEKRAKVGFDIIVKKDNEYKVLRMSER